MTTTMTNPATEQAEYISLGQRVRRIIREVAAAHRVGVSAIKGQNRTAAATAARYAAMRRLREEMPHLTYQQIAQQFGRHHTTVMYALGLLPGKHQRKTKG